MIGSSHVSQVVVEAVGEVVEGAFRDVRKDFLAVRVKLDELAGGSFTITNGGIYGSLMSTPILNPPQSGILGMHKIQDRPMAVGGKVEIRPMMYLALSYDHRIVDGKEAVTFLVRVKESLEDPALVARLAAARTPLTVCPLSNVKLCVFKDLTQHNIGALLDAGLCAMVNSDDPAYFGGYMNQNFVELFNAQPQLTARHAYQLALNSFEASFVDADQKRAWQHRLDAVFAAG